jgi:hypothetical protein
MGHPVRPKKGWVKKTFKIKREAEKKLKNNFKTLEASETSKKLNIIEFNLFN